MNYLGFFKTYKEKFDVSDLKHAKVLGEMLKTFADSQDLEIKGDVDRFYHFFKAIEPQFANHFCVCVIYQDALKYAKECQQSILLDAKKFMNFECRDFGSCGSISENIIGKIGLCCYGEFNPYFMTSSFEYSKSKAFQNRDKVCNFVSGFVKAEEYYGNGLDYLANYKTNSSENE